MESTSAKGLENTYCELSEMEDDELESTIDEAVYSLMEDFKGLVTQMVDNTSVSSNLLDAEGRFHRSMSNFNWLIWEKHRRAGNQSPVKRIDAET